LKPTMRRRPITSDRKGCAGPPRDPAGLRNSAPAPNQNLRSALARRRRPVGRRKAVNGALNGGRCRGSCPQYLHGARIRHPQWETQRRPKLQRPRAIASVSLDPSVRRPLQPVACLVCTLANMASRNFSRNREWPGSGAAHRYESRRNVEQPDLH